MDWVLDNIDWLFPIAVVLLFWIQNTFMKNPDEGKPPPGAPEADAEAERIREEIRRKIVARQQGQPLQEERPAREIPPPVRPQPAQEWPFAPQPQPVPIEPSPVEEVEFFEPQEDLLEELRKEQERLRRAQREREKALRQRKAQDRKRVEVVQPEVRRRGSIRDQVLADLATAPDLRRAFVLKEIVDRPVGIRPTSGGFSDWT